VWRLQGQVGAGKNMDRDSGASATLVAEIDQKNTQLEAIRARLEARDRNAMCKSIAYAFVIFIAGVVAGSVVSAV
jgi:hypothetical protein